MRKHAKFMIPRNSPKSRTTLRHRPAFALVTALLMMIMLSILATGLLSLSAVTLRESTAATATREARSNARLALQLAVAQLQENAGVDTAITAGAGAGTAQLTGVWHPLPPVDVAAPDYDKDARFRTWLVSTPRPDDARDPALPLRSKGENVPMLGRGTLGEDARVDDEVAVPTMPLPPGPGGRSGAMAWWTSDESTKARVDLRSEGGNPDLSGKIGRQLAPARPASGAVAMFAGIAPDDLRLDQGVTRDSIGLLAAGGPHAIRSHWHDITTASVGLLTDVREGGLKSDLSLLFEQPRLPADFKQQHGEFLYTHHYGHPRATNNSWLRNNFATGGPRWEYLHDYYRLYREMRFRDGVPTIRHRYNFGTGDLGGYRQGVIQYQKRQTVMPVFAKLQFVMSAMTVQHRPPGGRPERRLVLITEPVVTLWNPYNIRLEVRDLRLRPYAMPWQFDITHNGSSRTAHHLDILPYHSLWLNFPKRIELEPGETRVYSNNAPAPLDVSWTSNTGAQIELTEGWAGSGGYFDSSKGFAGSGHVTIEMAVADDAHYEQSGGWAGSRLCMLYWSTYAEGGRTDWGMETWFEVPRISRNGLLRVDGAPNTGLTFENLAANKTEICSFNISMKTTADRRWPNRSWIHGNPCDANNNMIVYQRNSGGEIEPLELAQNRMAIGVSYAGDIDLIQIEVPPSNAGFIASGNTAGDGVSHAVHQELPIAPIQSLAQFQHANLISTGFAPFQSKALGNSLAHPMLRPDRSREPAYKTQNNTEECDHSFLLNDRLFDRWFLSTLVARDAPIHRISGGAVPLDRVFADFAAGSRPLANPRIAPREGLPPDDPAPVRGAEAWRHIAKALEVRGPFNVNSTSETAWKMMIASAAGNEVAHLERGGAVFRATTSRPEGVPVGRFAMPVDGALESSRDPRQAAWLGFRELDDAQLDALARAMVREVEKRGPFLSLSEFVNRRLDTGELGLMGALQAAIEATDINDRFKTPSQMVRESDIAGIPYDNPAAALGSKATGAPGYLMQADVLTQLAPVMTVRGDTFLIRAYGDARDASGRVIARAWCEALVQRRIDFLDPADPPEAPTARLSPTNRRFGRSFDVISFRWLSADTI